MRSRSPSTTAVAHAIRRGSIKISWPIANPADDAQPSPTLQPPNAATANLGPAVAPPSKAPSRPARPDSPVATPGVALAYRDANPASNAPLNAQSAAGSSRRTPRPASRNDDDRLQPGPAPRTVRGHRAASSVLMGSTPVSQLRKKGSSVRSMLRRLLRRSTVKGDAGAAEPLATPTPAARMTIDQAESSSLQHRSVSKILPCRI
jgi:hypothetical protein